MNFVLRKPVFGVFVHPLDTNHKILDLEVNIGSKKTKRLISLRRRAAIIPFYFLHMRETDFLMKQLINWTLASNVC